MPSWLAHVSLAWPLAKRDVLARYRGSVLGVAWALVLPLGMVAIYALVFQGVFKARWAVPGETAEAAGAFGYTARVFAGLIVFQAFAEVCARATRLMADNANLVKRVVFPLELLVVALLLQVAVHSLMQMGLLAVLLVLFADGLQLSWLWLPAALAWTLALQFALALVLAAVGTYVRDLQHVVPVVMTGLMFLSPLFYPAAAAPEGLALLLSLNPLTAPMEFMRAAWFGHGWQVASMAPQALLLLLALPLSLALFRRLRPGFADLV
jgi:lipopolysaccharide transport system permease protein